MRIAPQAVLRRLVLEERVDDERARAQIRAQRSGHGLRRLAAAVAIGVLETRQALLERGRLVASGQRHLEGGGLLREQALEGRAAGHARLGEDALLGLRELVGEVAAEVAQVVGAERELGCREQLIGALVGNLVPLEVEEEQLGLDPGGELARLLHARAAPGIRRVEREAEHGVGPGTPREVVDGAELLHRLRQLARVELVDSAAVSLGERLAALARLVQHRLDGLGPAVVDQWLEVPVGRFQLLVGGCAHEAEVIQGPSISPASSSFPPHSKRRPPSCRRGARCI